MAKDSVDVIPLPALAALAWIPFYLRIEDIPQNDYTHARPMAYDRLFDSGNMDPPDDLESEAGFDEVKASHDFRAAMFLDGLALARGRDGKLTWDHTRIRRIELPGYTPLRYINRSVEERGKGEKLKKSWPLLPETAGNGAGRVQRLSRAGAVQFVQEVEFRLCKVLAIGSGILTGNLRGAPFAWMRVVQTVEEDGSYEVRCTGSAVPSQLLYVNWKVPEDAARPGEPCEYDMLTATNAAMEAFLNAGRVFGDPRKALRAPERDGNAMVYREKLW